MRLHRTILLEKLAQTRCASLMQCAAQGHFDGFQIESPGPAPFCENHPQQRIYFPRDFLMDRNSRFFSSGVQPALACSSGRRPQIFSLMATSSALSF